MIDGVDIPLPFTSVSSPKAVATKSLHELYFEETVSNGTLKHDIVNHIQVGSSRNTPSAITKLISYGYYNK